MSTAPPVPLVIVRRRFGETARRDAWWIQPLVVFLGFSTFVVYATWAAFQGDHYTYGPYLSPFYSPELFGSSPHSWFGPKPAAWPAWLPFSPALLILPIPGLFRLTCYYYRGAYYKASGAIRLPARSASRGRATGARIRFRSSCRTFTATCCSSRCSCWSSLPTTCGRRCGSPAERPGDGHVRDRRRHAHPGREYRAARRISVRVPFDAACRRRVRRSAVARAARSAGLQLRQLPQSPAHGLGLDQPVQRRLLDLYVRLCSMGVWSDRRISVMPEYQTHEHDVLVIGAGGAGLQGGH